MLIYLDHSHLCGYSAWLADWRTTAAVNVTELRGRWRLDEGSGGIAYDSSSYARHGLIQGPSWTVLQQACP